MQSNDKNNKFVWLFKMFPAAETVTGWILTFYNDRNKTCFDLAEVKAAELILK